MGGHAGRLQDHHRRVSYLAVTGPPTEAAAEPYVGSLLVQGCKVVVASGPAERAAALADAGKFSNVRFVVQGAAAGRPPNVTALAFTTTGLRAAVAAAVTAGIHAADPVLRQRASALHRVHDLGEEEAHLHRDRAPG
ncbi:MAG TPA: hypothetical protein VF174_00400 [Micromonosporaceae bacterium]